VVWLWTWIVVMAVSVGIRMMRLPHLSLPADYRH
jgi:hypothetical protein